jgi:hypothetical protein
LALKYYIIFCFIISFVNIFKEDIMVDHWNVFLMGKEEDDLGEIGPSNLGGASPNNLGEQVPTI